MALKLRAAANTVHSGAEQKLKTSLNLAEGGTTNGHKARSDGSPDPPPSGVLTARPRNLRGFVFVDKCAAARPGRSLDWLKLKLRKSGIQARHLYISARKRSGLRHAGKIAYPVKPLNVESLDRPIRAHKKQGNHPAGVIVDMQFPCHSTPHPRCGFNARNPAVGSTVGATCQCRSEYSSLCGGRGGSRNGRPPS